MVVPASNLLVSGRGRLPGRQLIAAVLNSSPTPTPFSDAPSQLQYHGCGEKLNQFKLTF